MGAMKIFHTGLKNINTSSACVFSGDGEEREPVCSFESPINLYLQCNLCLDNWIFFSLKILCGKFFKMNFVVTQNFVSCHKFNISATIYFMIMYDGDNYVLAVQHTSFPCFSL